jgi:hypothetical protein
MDHQEGNRRTFHSRSADANEARAKALRSGRRMAGSDVLDVVMTLPRDQTRQAEQPKPPHVEIIVRVVVPVRGSSRSGPGRSARFLSLNAGGESDAKRHKPRQQLPLSSWTCLGCRTR